MENSALIPKPKEDSEHVRPAQGPSTETGTVHSPVSPHGLGTLPAILGNRSAQRMLAPLVIQPKLTVGAPDDVYEKEADAVAEQIMSFRQPQAAGDSGSDDDSHPILTRKPADPRLARQALLGRIPIRMLQQNLGNRALARLLAEKSPALPIPELRRKCACGGEAPSAILEDGSRPREEPRRPALDAIRVGTATAMEDEGKTDSGEFEGEPMTIEEESPDQTPAPLSEEGLIDGEWSSEVAAHAFVNGGKAGTAIVNWAGGAGGTTPGIGSVTTVAPVIETSGPGDAGTAQAWVRGGTGTATVSRNYTGVLVGANGANYYITASAAARIDRHEENHIAHSKTRHDASISPLETRIAAHTGQANALNQGADVAAAKTALETLLKWNDSITSFRNGDNADNLPGGAVDTADAASADFYRDYGAKTVGGVNYPHYVDTPPGP